MMIKMINGDNVKVSHVTVDDDIGSYWSMYRMVMAIIYTYYDEVYLCQKKLRTFSSCVKTRFFTFYIHFLEWCVFQAVEKVPRCSHSNCNKDRRSTFAMT